MIISRRKFLLTGSAASTLWLTGCGGGGSADGLPKKVSVTPASCSARSTTGINAPTVASDFVLKFTNSTAFQSPSIDMELDSTVLNMYSGCTNQYVAGVEGLTQELFVSLVQYLPMSQTLYSTDLVRTLRLHLSIPHDDLNATLYQGDIYNVGDPTNPSGCFVFSGSMIVSAPNAADGSNCWAYDITSGTVQILDDFNGVFSGSLRLSNVVATAAQAGSGNNAAYAGGGKVQMDGVVPVYFEALSFSA